MKPRFTDARSPQTGTGAIRFSEQLPNPTVAPSTVKAPPRTVKPAHLADMSEEELIWMALASLLLDPAYTLPEWMEPLTRHMEAQGLIAGNTITQLGTTHLLEFLHS